MKSVVAGILASPRFLYIIERKRDATKEEPLTPHELATRLSFFFWSSIPDEELLEKARSGDLVKPGVYVAQVKRMLEDRRSKALAENFARQWLRLDQLITAVPDFDRFEIYYSRRGCEQWKFGLQTMVEPLLLFESIMVEDRSIMLLVDSNYSYRSDELQSWYKDEVPFGKRANRDRFNTEAQSYRRRTLDTRREGGVMTSTAALTMTSSPLRTNPIRRDAPFTCAHCGAGGAIGGARVRDHCPGCLRSLHVDRVPGDRAASCGGILDPVDLTLEGRGQGKWVFRVTDPDLAIQELEDALGRRHGPLEQVVLLGKVLDGSEETP